jgi:hypothetical protein
MQRRIMLFTAFLALWMSAPASYGDSFLDRILNPLTPHKKLVKAGASHASETVWSGLVIAENADKPQPVPFELARFEQTLKDLFGYNQFQVIGESRKALKTGQEDWLASSKHFALHVDAQGPSEGGYVVNLKLLQRDDAEPQPSKPILETDTRLSKRSPLVIKGPQIGGGQLLLVLVVQ